MTPDHSQFTASVLGEASPDNLVDYAEALKRDPSLEAESLAIRLTAARLTTALKSEPAIRLTPSQRRTVLHPAPAPLVRKARRPAWIMPTLTTLGIAAAVATGLFAGPDGPRAVSPAVESGIPSVAIQPSSSSKTGVKPATRPPAVAGPAAVPGIPPATAPSNPLVPAAPGAMAATPPVLEGLPSPSRQPDGVLKEILPPAGFEPLPPGSRPGEALASPPRP